MCNLLRQMAIEYAAAYQMSVEQTAEVLADAYIKGLLWAHHDAHGESPAAWTPAEFVSCTEVCWPLERSALLDLLPPVCQARSTDAATWYMLSVARR